MFINYCTVVSRVRLVEHRVFRHCGRKTQMTCTHGATVRITKMKRGESFSLTHMMHMKAEQMKVKFFCSDVVCKYSKWAVKVGKLFPEYKSFTATIKWFLSRFHGLVHGWGCRVMN